MKFFLHMFTTPRGTISPPYVATTKPCSMIFPFLLLLLISHHANSLAKLSSTKSRQLQVQNHYAVLGVSKDDSSAAIKKRYIYLAKQTHPDSQKIGDNTALFKSQKLAYEVLVRDGDLSRLQYDRALALDQVVIDAERALDNLFNFFSTKLSKVEKPKPPKSPPPLNNELPPNWVEHSDVLTGTAYYHNGVSGETTWERPVAAPAAPPPFFLETEAEAEAEAGVEKTHERRPFFGRFSLQQYLNQLSEGS